LADRVFLSYDAAAPYFQPAKVRVVGTPVRRAFLERTAEPDMKVTQGPTLLIFGGSQGSHAINHAMVEALPHMRILREGWSVIHQTGEADHAAVRAAYAAVGILPERAEVVPFLYDMPRALRSADLVVSRAGAVTLAELAACGKPALLVPLPSAIYHHQEQNARVVEQAGAARVMLQKTLNGPALAQTLDQLAGDAGRLRAMGERSRALGRIDAAEAIVQECIALVETSHGTKFPLGAGRS
jgi:UDP-N-acetylglucosamine--N-acetylmuramyl-(pentapeptide) pyrophosphoryl-undecaprenol N-acetylglucosamine transferase